MERHFREREKQERRGIILGAGLTAAMHLVLVLTCSFSGMKYIWPPPQEQSFIIDFVPSEEDPEIKQRTGRQPQAEDADKDKAVDLVQAAKAQLPGNKANKAAEATVGTDGDVETPEPPREKPIERRALFHAPDNPLARDTLAPQTAKSPSELLKEGHAAGNVEKGKKDGSPNARLQGRTVKGSLTRPEYNSQESGTVVVSIHVDQYGKVVKALAGAEGTTVNDRTLWDAARKAALEAHFNMSADAPALQEGTITYKFNLK